MSEFLSFCEQAARAGGAQLMDWMGRFEVREKGPADLVTDADLASQKVIRELLLGRFPDHGFLGEEEDEIESSSSEYRWIVDPLDGTANYAHQARPFCVSIALERQGEMIVGVVFDPVADECYLAEQGQGAWLNGKPIKASPTTTLGSAMVAVSFPPNVSSNSVEVDNFTRVLERAQSMRRTGSAALNLAYVACGRFDAYWATENKIWDVAAGMLLVTESGGLVRSLADGKIDFRRPQLIATSTNALHDELRANLQVA